jgi:hypothetical protein
MDIDNKKDENNNDTQDMLSSTKVSAFFTVRSQPISAPIIHEIQPLPDDEKIDYTKSLVEQGSLKEIKIARFDRIYKRKVPSKLGYQCIQKIEGYRFCKFCNANLPLSAFYTSYKRYVCRRHHYLRVRKRLQEASNENAMVSHACKCWFYLNDRKFMMGYDKLRYDLGDIRQIFTHLQSVIPIHKLNPVVVPIDYTQPLRPRNIAIISQKAFGTMINLMKFAPHRPIYVAFVQHLNLVPINFDVGFPKDPYHDPEYRRQDIDIKTLYDIDADFLCKKESEDADIIQEFKNGDDVPWLNCPVLPAGEAGLWKDGKPVNSAPTV